MIGRAPGKVILSGAYAVLEGAPAIVAAADRFVVADGARDAELVTDEVRAAIELGAIARAPAFDASALRMTEPDGTSRKLGLGSSAAILVASLAAAWPALARDVGALRDAIFPVALAAHRRAQAGGSGVDVAASVYGGVLLARPQPPGELAVAPHALPGSPAVTVLAFARSASTRELVGRVHALRDRDRPRYDALIGRACDASEAAARAGSLAALLAALDAQLDALDALGAAAGAPIVLPELRALATAAAREGAVVGTAGAGGGDLAILVGEGPPGAALLARARELGLAPTGVALGAPGVAIER